MSASATAVPLATSTSTTSAEDSGDPEGVLFFAYGALMDPTTMQRRLQGRHSGLLARSSSSSSSSHSSSSRAAVAVAFAERKGRGRRRQQQRDERVEASSAAAASSSVAVAVAFAHRGGWATLVDLREARASTASPLWRLVPGSQRGGEDGGGGWGARARAREGPTAAAALASTASSSASSSSSSAIALEREENKSDDTGNGASFIGGSCFSSPAHGVLYSLSSESELEALAEREGGYCLRRVEVRVVSLGDDDDDDGGGGGGGCGGQRALLLEAFAFVSSPGLRLRLPLPPRERYLDKMRSGARAAGLDGRYRAWLEEVPSAAEGSLDGRYQATPAGAAAAAAGVALFAAVVCSVV